MVSIFLLFWGNILVLLAISLAAGWVLGKLLLRIASFFVRKTSTTLDDRIFEAIKPPVESFLFLAIFYFFVLELPKYVQEITDLSAAAVFLERYTLAFLIVIITYTTSKVAGALLRWYYEEGSKSSRVKLDVTLIPFLRKFSELAIYFVGLTAAVGAAGFDVTGLIALSSIVGIVIGFASQETLANIFAGMALQLDRPYHYGDYVRFSFGGETAKVKKIGLCSTMLEDSNGAAIIISNSELAKQRLVNFSYPSSTFGASFPADVPLSTDLKKLHAHLQQALAQANPTGYEPSSLKLNAGRIKEASLELSVSYRVAWFPNSAPIQFLLNEKMLEFLKKGRK